MLPAIPNLNQFVWDIPDTLVPEDPLLEPQEGRYIPIRMLNDDLLIDVFTLSPIPKTSALSSASVNGFITFLEHKIHFGSRDLHVFGQKL